MAMSSCKKGFRVMRPARAVVVDTGMTGRGNDLGNWNEYRLVCQAPKGWQLCRGGSPMQSGASIPERRPSALFASNGEDRSAADWLEESTGRHAGALDLKRAGGKQRDVPPRIPELTCRMGWSRAVRLLEDHPLCPDSIKASPEAPRARTSPGNHSGRLAETSKGSHRPRPVLVAGQGMLQELVLKIFQKKRCEFGGDS